MRSLMGLVSLVLASIPSFWLGLLLITLVAEKGHLLPVAGYGGPQYLILPVLALSVGPAAGLMRITRGAVIEVWRQDYVRTARANAPQVHAHQDGVARGRIADEHIQVGSEIVIRDEVVGVADEDDKTAIGAECRGEGTASRSHVGGVGRRNRANRCSSICVQNRGESQNDPREDKPVVNFHRSRFHFQAVRVGR
jgi:hypothetical protein